MQIISVFEVTSFYKRDIILVPCTKEGKEFPGVFDSLTYENGKICLYPSLDPLEKIQLASTFYKVEPRNK